MASALRSLLLLCGICGLLAGVSCQTLKGYCPKGWTRLNNRCFIYQHDPRSFPDAERVCNILGGNLASINSALENQVVIEIIRAAAGTFKDTWIGYQDSILEGDFIWTDGSSAGFDDFETGQPNEGVPPEDCVDIEASTEQWHDDNCADLSPYVCAKKVHIKKH
ncbi:galactose-specific lectin nattectin-like [Hippocampus comes]|uniref:Galactose-specific lectin nattectin-like n=1 Tax=Hippocampus comes TaxID=109280 RepID=A0A3Q3D5R3_HIPCM|nr:PREDICTED: galactose-specific lectin nattectin-like [Hippocampus comes]